MRLQLFLAASILLFVSANRASFGAPSVANPAQFALLPQSTLERDFKDAPWMVLSGIRECAVVLDAQLSLKRRNQILSAIQRSLSAGGLPVVSLAQARSTFLPILTLRIRKNGCYVELTQVGIKDGQYQRLPIWYARIRDRLSTDVDIDAAIEECISQLSSDCRKAN